MVTKEDRHKPVLFLSSRRTFWVRPVGSWVLESGNVVAEALAVSLDKPLEWAVGFFFGNTELSLELWVRISANIKIVFSPDLKRTCNASQIDRDQIH